MSTTITKQEGRLLREVVRYIQREALLDSEALHLVALSGGADSVSLLLALQGLGYRVEAAHCNFHLRGEESVRDEEFVKSLCVERGVKLHLVHFDTLEYASLHKVSVEMAARDLRYAYFERLRGDIGAATICVAHHREDSVETVLINLLRGTGIDGLRGIRPRNGHVVRPLLCVSRREIEDYLRNEGQPYVTDSTNLVADVVRNKVRLEVMPLLRSINPKADECIGRTSAHLAEAAKVLDDATARARERVGEFTPDTASIRIDALEQEPSAEYLLHDILTGYGFPPAVISILHDNLHAQTGKVFDGGTFKAALDRGRIIVGRPQDPMKPLRIPEEGTYIINNVWKLRVERRQVDAGFSPSRNPSMATLDASGVRFPLVLRNAQEADRFTPFGMKGSKLVSDYMADRHKTYFEKLAQLVLSDASGRILWLPGERTDNRFRISPSTTSILQLSLEPAR